MLGGVRNVEGMLEVVTRLDLCDLGPLAASCTTVAAALRGLVDPFCAQRRVEVQHMDLICSVLRAALLMSERGLQSLRRDDGKTVLSLAAGAGRPDVVRWLLLEAPERETRMDQPDKVGATALHYAALGGHEHVCELLLAQGASADPEDGTGTCPLHLAAQGGHFAACAALIENGAKVDPRDGDSATPLLLAAAEGYGDVCAYLVGQRADPLASTKQGESALGVAQNSGSKELMEGMMKALWAPRKPCQAIVVGPEAQQIMQRAMFQRPLI